MKDEALSILSLFASTSTLLCCALPVVLVTLGFGAFVAGAVSSVPGLVTLSNHSGWVFAVAGVLSGGNWLFLNYQDRRAAAAACEVTEDSGSSPEETACETAGRFSRAVLWIATGLYIIGFTVAYPAVWFAEYFVW